MKLLLLFSGLALSLSLAAQYPTNSIKSRLGYQTTGDGLVYRGAGAPAYSPGTLFNAWMYLDTTNYTLYMYRNFQWTKLPLVNNGLTLDGSYVQLGGTLVENTQVERSTYSLDFGKISGSNNGWLSFYGTDPHYVGILTTKDGTESGLTIGNKLWGFEVDDSDHTFQFNGTRFGFDATYLGTLGVSQFKMDSTRFYIRGLPTYATHAAADADIDSYGMYQITDGRAMYSRTGTADKVSPNLFDNNTYAGVISRPWKFGEYTTAGLPTGVTGYTLYNTDIGGIGWYDATRWNYVPKADRSAFTSTRIPVTNSSGQFTEYAGFNFSQTTGLNVSETGVTQDYLLDLSGTTTSNSSTSLGGLRINGGFTYSSGSNPPAYGILVDPTFTGSFGGGAAGVYITAKSAYSGFGSAAIRINTSSSNGIYITGSSNRALIELNPTTSGTRSIYGIAAADNIYSNISFIRNTTNLNTGVGMRFATLYTGSGNSDAGYSYELGSVMESYTGGGSRQALVFRNISNSVTTERMRLNESGFLGLGTTSPSEQLHITDDLRVGDSTRLTTTPAHTAITGLLTRDANGWVGLASLAGGLSYGGGVLTGANIYTADGTIASGTDRTITLGAGGNITYYNDPSYMGIENSFANTSGADYESFLEIYDKVSSFSTGHSVETGGVVDALSNIHFIEKSTTKNKVDDRFRGQYNSDRKGFMYGGLIDSVNKSQFVGVFANFDSLASGSTSKISAFSGFVQGKSDYLDIRVRGLLKSWVVQSSVRPSASSVLPFNWLEIRNPFSDTTSNSFWMYEKYNFSNSTPGTGSNVHVWDNGTPSFKEIKRDTTIYVDDADYDFSAAITTAQIASRYNRVIFWMTTTGAAGSDSELTLHTPDVNLMQVEYLIHSVDEAGGFENKIVFGSNNAVDSTNGLVTNYFPAAGDGVHIRAGLRSGVYKYRYSN